MIPFLIYSSIGAIIATIHTRSVLAGLFDQHIENVAGKDGPDMAKHPLGLTISWFINVIVWPMVLRLHFQRLRSVGFGGIRRGGKIYRTKTWWLYRIYAVFLFLRSKQPPDAGLSWGRPYPDVPGRVGYVLYRLDDGQTIWALNTTIEQAKVMRDSITELIDQVEYFNGGENEGDEVTADVRVAETQEAKSEGDQGEATP